MTTNNETTLTAETAAEEIKKAEAALRAALARREFCFGFKKTGVTAARAALRAAKAAAKNVRAAVAS